ncbi:hypothetical protein NK983_31435, partial [Salmonella enterica subsp. enterica serovar Typhimurium]|nr:hypothetical protein [Salmonella enterica subsp. enterica serovar Typhimurium]
QIIVMGDIGAGATLVIARPDPARKAAPQALHGMLVERLQTLSDELHQIAQRPSLDYQRAVHIGFAEGKRWIEDEPDR